MLKFIDICNILIFQFIAGFEKRKNYIFETTTCCQIPDTQDQSESTCWHRPPRNISTFDMEYGRKNILVGLSGLWINKKYVRLGASPEGLIFCPSFNRFNCQFVKVF